MRLREDVTGQRLAAKLIPQRSARALQNFAQRNALVFDLASHPVPSTETFSRGMLARSSALSVSAMGMSPFTVNVAGPASLRIVCLGRIRQRLLRPGFRETESVETYWHAP